MIEFVKQFSDNVNFEDGIELKCMSDSTYIVVRGQMCLHCKFIIEALLFSHTKSISKAK